MHVEDAIGTEQNVMLQANWHYMRSRYKRIQLYRRHFQEVSGPIRIKLKKLVSGQIFIFLGQFFSTPTVKCLPVRLWLDAPLKNSAHATEWVPHFLRPVLLRQNLSCENGGVGMKCKCRLKENNIFYIKMTCCKLKAASILWKFITVMFVLDETP